MIGWAIELARSSGIFNRIIVSTDDLEIARVAQDFGADVPFIRPPELSADFVPTLPVIQHMLTAVASDTLRMKRVCCIYPCVPTLDMEDLREADRLVKSGKSEYEIVYTVAEYTHPIQRALAKAGDGRMHFIQPESAETRTQDLGPTYYDAGQFYFASVDTWLAANSLHEGGYGIKIPRWRAIDIDSFEDWYSAELWVEALALSRERETKKVL